MTCQTVWNLIDLYKEGRLSSGRAAELKAHLDGCASCAALAAPPKVEAPKAPASLKERLKALSAAGTETKAPIASAPSSMRELPTAAFALVVAWLGLLWLAHAATAKWPVQQGDAAGEAFTVRRLP